MTRKSAFFPRTEAACPTPVRAGTRGFTLLELLVVLSIIAAVAAVVGPSAWRVIDNAERRGTRADALAVLAGLPLEAFSLGQPLRLDAEALSRRGPKLPDSCRYVLPNPPLVYAGNGMAAGGRVQLVCGDDSTAFDVAPVTGEVRLAEGDR